MTSLTSGPLGDKTKTKKGENVDRGRSQTTWTR